MCLILDFVSQPYLGFMRWMVGTQTAIRTVVFILWFYGGTLLYASGTISIGRWMFGQDTWLCNTFIFGMSLIFGIYHFFYIFPRRFGEQPFRRMG